MANVEPAGPAVVAVPVAAPNAELGVAPAAGELRTLSRVHPNALSELTFD